MNGWIRVLDVYKLNGIDGDGETITLRVASQCNDLMLCSQVQAGTILEARQFQVLWYQPGETFSPLNIAILLTNFSVKGYVPLSQEMLQRPIKRLDVTMPSERRTAAVSVDGNSSDSDSSMSTHDDDTCTLVAGNLIVANPYCKISYETKDN
jgi:hypothetical protein